MRFHTPPRLVPTKRVVTSRTTIWRNSARCSTTVESSLNGLAKPRQGKRETALISVHLGADVAGLTSANSWEDASPSDKACPQ